MISFLRPWPACARMSNWSGSARSTWFLPRWTRRCSDRRQGRQSGWAAHRRDSPRSAARSRASSQSMPTGVFPSSSAPASGRLRRSSPARRPTARDTITPGLQFHVRSSSAASVPLQSATPGYEDHRASAGRIAASAGAPRHARGLHLVAGARRLVRHAAGSAASSSPRAGTWPGRVRPDGRLGRERQHEHGALAGIRSTPSATTVGLRRSRVRWPGHPAPRWPADRPAPLKRLEQGSGWGGGCRAMVDDADIHLG